MLEQRRTATRADSPAKLLNTLQTASNDQSPKVGGDKVEPLPGGDETTAGAGDLLDARGDDTGLEVDLLFGGVGVDLAENNEGLVEAAVAKKVPRRLGKEVKKADLENLLKKGLVEFESAGEAQTHRRGSSESDHVAPSVRDVLEGLRERKGQLSAVSRPRV